MREAMQAKQLKIIYTNHNHLRPISVKETAIVIPLDNK